MKKQGGFTLIELVVVIVILGLLAATALPRFINVTDDARAASVNGVAGGLRSAASLSRAQYIVNGSNAATIVSMEGQNVDVLDESTYANFGGRPQGTATGIRLAMPDPSDYTITAAGGATGAVTYVPVGGNTTNCRVIYTPNAAGDPVDAVTTGC